MGYQHISQCYDIFTDDVDYQRWASYVQSLFARAQVSPQLLLELGCGTGNLTEELCTRGYDMIGVDVSKDMLSIAYEKSKDAGLDILYLCQDMSSFELYGTVGGVVCCLDSLNCLTDSKKLLACFKLVHLYLDSGGVFIFDVNTAYKMEHILDGNTFFYDSPEASCIWENSYRPSTKVCQFDLTFFLADGNEQYRKEYDCIRERAYSVRQLSSYLAQAGFAEIEALEEFTFDAPKKESERIFFVAKKA